MHPSIALMLRSRQNRAIAARILARLGNRGDTMLAHINPAEALMLKRMGGAGTLNPRTGLRQFWEDGGGAGNSQGHAGANGADGGGGAKGGNSGGGNTGISNGDGRVMGGGYAGGYGDAPGAYGGYGADTGGYTHNSGVVGPDGKVQGKAPVSEQQAQTRAAYNHAYADAKDYGNTAGENIGNAVLRGLGISEIDPASQGYGAFAPNSTTGAPVTPGANWGADALDMGLGLAGMATGLPLGAIYSGAKLLGAVPPGFGVVNLGPNPLGGAGSAASGSWGGGSANAGNNIGANGGGQHDGGSRNTLPGRTPPGTGGMPTPGTGPAPGTQPAGLPPAANPALAGLYSGGLAGDPFAGRFGANPFLSPYLIVANQPAAPGYLTGLWR